MGQDQGRWHGKRVGVLYGGRSSEREVSLNTGKGCAEAIRGKGYETVLIDVDLEIAARLRAEKIDVAFIALHGRWGEDGCIQGLLESMGIPYTGSGVLSSAMAMDKVVSKLLFAHAGLSVIDYKVFPPSRAPDVVVADIPFGLPAVVKPAGEGSSVGVHIVRGPEALNAACLDAVKYKGDLLVERYMPGKELAVAVLDDKALGAIEIVPANEFYDYAAKYTAGTTQYFYPARIPTEQYQAACRDAEAAHKSLSCAGASRVDFILGADGKPYILEVNTLPGMTATSLVPKIAAGVGIDFGSFCERLLEGAGLRA
jgi:D-alanine-D-alanine ligase